VPCKREKEKALWIKHSLTNGELGNISLRSPKNFTVGKQPDVRDSKKRKKECRIHHKSKTKKDKKERGGGGELLAKFFQEYLLVARVPGKGGLSMRGGT